jgi:hypothetical protein
MNEYYTVMQGYAMNDECDCDRCVFGGSASAFVLKSFGKRYKSHSRQHVRGVIFPNTFTLERTELFAEENVRGTRWRGVGRGFLTPGASNHVGHT